MTPDDVVAAALAAVPVPRSSVDAHAARIRVFRGRRGVTAAAAAAGEAVLGFVAANALAAGIVVADWLATDPGTIELEREPPVPLSIGRQNPVPLMVRNTGAGRARVTVADRPRRRRPRS